MGVNNDGLQEGTFFRRVRLRAEHDVRDLRLVRGNQLRQQRPGTRSDQGRSADSEWISGQALEPASRPRSPAISIPSPTDLWWNFREVPLLGNIQLGNEKEPFSVERLESSRYLDFMERNYAQDAFISPSANGFAPGIMAWNWLPSRRGTYAYGLFKNVTNPFVFNVGDGQAEGAGRFTYLLWYDEPSGGRYFAHVGIGGAVRGVDNGIITYRVAVIC